jgi:hypothetical protein
MKIKLKITKVSLSAIFGIRGVENRAILQNFILKNNFREAV